MADVATLLGPVSSSDLGIVSLHEHLLFGLHGWQYAPDVDFNHSVAFQQIRTSLEQFKELGGGTIVDTSGITLGRDVPFYSQLSQATGVKIVAATGFDNEPISILQHFSWVGTLYAAPGPFETQSQRYSPYVWHREIPGHFYPSYGASKEYLMFLFYNELTRGMAAPGMIRTKMKAGIVKAGSSWEGITGPEELSLRGAAIAARRTGLAVTINGINQARRQLEIMEEEGLDPGRVVIGHCDDRRAIDLERDRGFAQRGVYVAYDHIGWEDPAFPHSLPDEQRVQLVKAMVEGGFTERVILSCSTIGYALGVPQPRHSFSHLLKSFIPKLKKAGVSDGDIDTILRENPRRILTRQEPRGARK